MKQIDIVTSQYVTIRYSLAAVMDRILAFFIDLLIAGIITVVMFFVFLILLNNSFKADTIWLLASIPPFLFYHLVMEAFAGGRSFGKKFLNIKPVKKNGLEMTFMDYLMRWIFRLPDILLSIGSLAVIMISSTSSAQRLGDMLANTVVIKTTDVHSLKLQQILKMNKTQENYQAGYPQVTQLSEKDVLLIKEVLDRNNTYHSVASQKSMRKMTELIEQKLGITAPQNKPAFLREIIRDYVYLTR